MAVQSRVQWFFWPVFLVCASLIVYVLHDLAFQRFIPDADRNAVRQISAAAARRFRVVIAAVSAAVP